MFLENSAVGILFLFFFPENCAVEILGEHCYGNTGCFVVENCVVGILYL